MGKLSIGRKLIIDGRNAEVVDIEIIIRNRTTYVSVVVQYEDSGDKCRIPDNSIVYGVIEKLIEIVDIEPEEFKQYIYN